MHRHVCTYWCTCRFECEENKRLHIEAGASVSSPPPPTPPVSPLEQDCDALTDLDAWLACEEAKY